MIRLLLRFSIFLAIAGQTFPLVAQDAPDKKTVKDSSGEKASFDLFAVPEGADEISLNLLIRRLARTAPPDRSAEGQRNHLQKINGALGEILARDINEELYLTALEFRLEILEILPELGDNTAIVKRTKLIDEMKRNKRESVKALAAHLGLQERIGRLPSLSKKAKKELVREVGDSLANTNQKNFKGLSRAVQSAMRVAQTLERLGDSKISVTAFKLYLGILEKKKYPELADVIQIMGSNVRRLGLLGEKIELSGLTVDGEQFDIEQYQGKVVLVDFWATWCPPCIAELPNIKFLYDAYHEKGFEVIGVSLDQDEETLVGFLEHENIKWPTIFFSEPEEQGWSNPVAQRCGVSQLPTAFLVNQDGKVVTLVAHGQDLRDELAKLLGPLEEKNSEEK